MFSCRVRGPLGWLELLLELLLKVLLQTFDESIGLYPEQVGF